MEDPYFYKLFRLMYEKKEKQMKILFDLLSGNLFLPETEYHNFCLHHLYRMKDEIKSISMKIEDYNLDNFYEINMGKNAVDIINMHIVKNKHFSLDEVYISKTISDYFNKGDLYTLSVLNWIKKISHKINYESCPNLFVEAEAAHLPDKFIVDLIKNYTKIKDLKHIRYICVMLSIFSNDEIICLSEIVKSPIVEVILLYLNPNRYNK
jgi:hypothetical protein